MTSLLVISFPVITLPDKNVADFDKSPAIFVVFQFQKKIGSIFTSLALFATIYASLSFRIIIQNGYRIEVKLRRVSNPITKHVTKSNKC